MKTSALFIFISILGHLFIIDALFYSIGLTPTLNIAVIIAYNVVWLAIALTILNHRQKEIIH